MRTKTMQHLNPVWEEKADFIIGINLQTELPNYDIVWEQLWCKKISNDHFMICCIPFFAKDLSLGDEVETDANNMVKSVIKPSGQYTFRVWFGDSKDPNIRNTIIKELVQTDCSIEWYSENLLAISCSEQNAQRIADFLFEKQNNGEIFYDTGKSGRSE